MAGARALWRANGMKETEMGNPIIAIVNSFTQFVPGHVHLHEIGQTVKKEIEKLGCFAAEFNTIAIDDGIAMGHDGMLYSLPSRDLIADSVEYMVNAHKADAMICICNCDKITPGMLMAAMRLNIPTIFVSGGPMEAGQLDGKGLDLIDAMVESADETISDEQVRRVEHAACPTCGSCSGMFTANSMNCLNEAIGLALPGNGTVIATHRNREQLFIQAARQIVENCRAYYQDGDESVLPRNIATRAAFLNAMTLDIAMGGSTNTVLHLLAIAQEAGVDFTIQDIDSLSRKSPVLCKVAPNSHYHIQDVNRAGGILSILAILEKEGLIDASVRRVDRLSLTEAIEQYAVRNGACPPEAERLWKSAPGNRFNLVMGSQENYYDKLDTDRSKGCIRDFEHAYVKDGGLAVLFGNIAQDGCIVKTAGVDENIFRFKGKAKVFEGDRPAFEAIMAGEIVPGDIIVIRYEGCKGAPGMKELMLSIDALIGLGLDKSVGLISDARFSGFNYGAIIGHVSPEAYDGGNIALVENGDEIVIDIPNGEVSMLVSEEELERRRAAWVCPPLKEEKGCLNIFAKMCRPAEEGGAMQPWDLDAKFHR